MLLEIKMGVRANPSGRGQLPRIMVLKCDVCSSQYERPYSKHRFEERIHRCSRKCSYGSRSTDGLGNRGAEIISRQCETCSKDLVAKPSSQRSSKMSFCDKKCYGLWCAAHPETYAENTARMHTPESVEKISQAIRSRMLKPDYVHPRLGTHHSEATKQAISQHHIETGCLNGPRNGMFGRKHSDKAKDAMSDKHTLAMINGSQRPYGKNTNKGTYEPVKASRPAHYKSGWELSLMTWLDACEDVVSWEYETVRIAYDYHDHKRWYVPDFIVSYVDGTRRMFEIKPKEFVNTEKNHLKENAAIRYCEVQGLTGYRTLTGDDLRVMKVI